MGADLDALDLQVIRLLQEDGRRPTAAIARQLDLPEATVRRRIERLLRDETVRVVAVVDNEKLGLPVHVLIGVQIELARAEEVGDALARLDEVRWVGVTTGPHEYVVEAFFHSTAHFHDFLVKKVARIPGVLRTQTSTVLRLAKNVYRWDELLEAGGDHEDAPAARRAPG